MPDRLTYRGFDAEKQQTGDWRVEKYPALSLSTEDAVRRVIDTFLKAHPEKEFKKEIEVRKPLARQKGEYSNKQFA